MAENNNTGLLIVGGVVVYLVASGKLAGLLSAATDPSKVPTGRKLPPTSGSVPIDDQIARGVGAAGCIGAGIATGLPALGFAAAPVCGYVGEKIWEGAKWTGKKVGQAASGAWNNTIGNISFGGNTITPEQRAATAKISKPVGFR